MLSTRLRIGSALVAAVGAVLWLDSFFPPFFPFLALFCGGIVWFAAAECCQLFQSVSLHVPQTFCQVGCLLLIASNWWSMTPTIEPICTTFVFLSWLGFLHTAWRFERNLLSGPALPSLAGLLFIWFYIGISGSFLVQVRRLGTPAEGAFFFFLAIFLPKVCDMGAYFVGKRVGRHKLCARLSPQKTWEGALGGWIATVLLALFLAGPHFVGVTWRPTAWNGWLALSLAALVGVVAQLGDLLESLIKRDCGQKDASHSIPGFGGWLDVIDSVLFAAPVTYWWLRWQVAASTATTSTTATWCWI